MEPTLADNYTECVFKLGKIIDEALIQGIQTYEGERIPPNNNYLTSRYKDNVYSFFWKNNLILSVKIEESSSVTNFTVKKEFRLNVMQIRR
jgi:hypothetical protein